MDTATLKGLLEKASDGEWTFDCTDRNEPAFPDVWAIHSDDEWLEATLCEFWSGEHNNAANAALICALRNNAEELIASAERVKVLEAALRDATALIDHATDIMTYQQVGKWTGVRAFLESGISQTIPQDNSEQFRAALTKISKIGIEPQTYDEVSQRLMAAVSYARQALGG